MSQYLLPDLKNEFSLEDDVTYLNSASVGPLPIRSHRTMNEFYQLAGKTPWRVDYSVDKAFNEIRELGAKLVGADASGMTIGYTTGYGSILAANGLHFDPGDEVILADNDFPSNIYAWSAARDRGATLRFAKSSDGTITAQSIADQVSGKTKVIAVSFVQYYNGAKLPLEEISRIAQDCGAYLVVDGIQGVGPEPINCHELKIDLLSAGAQKWLLGPAGIGILYVSPRLRDALGPVARSWRSVRWDDFTDLFHYDKAPFEDARRFSFGTMPMAHVVGLRESLALLDELGAERIHRHCRALMDRLIDALSGAPGYRIVSPLEERERSAILSFTSDDYEQVFDRLISERVICVKREGAIRVSVYIYNTVADIDRLIALLGV